MLDKKVSDIAHITPAAVYAALSPALAQALHLHCKLSKDHPAAVLHDALKLYLEDGELAIGEATLVELAAAAEVVP